MDRITITASDIVKIYPSQFNQPLLKILNGDKHSVMDNPDIMHTFMQHNVGLHTNGNEYFFITMFPVNELKVKKFFLEITLPYREKKCRIKIRSELFNVDHIKQNPTNDALFYEYTKIFPLYTKKQNEFPVKITPEFIRVISNDDD